MKVGFKGIPVILLGCSRHPPNVSPIRTSKGTSFVLFGNHRFCLANHDHSNCDQSLVSPPPLSSSSTTNAFGFSSNNGNSNNNLSATCVKKSFLASLIFFILATATVPLSAFARSSVESNNQNYGSSSIPISATSTTKSPTENYLPRRLYPGTYKNYCGPTPEVTVRDGCKAHGWHGDEPLDLVDSTCRLHDISYCQCETQLIVRKNANRQTQQRPPKESKHATHNTNDDNNNNNVENLDMESLNDIPLLSALVALRFVTQPVLTQTQTVDMEYLNCIHKADTELIASGVRIRRQQQQTACQSTTTDTLGSSRSSDDPSSLNWFCKDVRTDDSSSSTEGAKEVLGLERLWSNKNNNHKRKDATMEQQDGTLSTFENVNMYIFLKNLDADEHHDSYPRRSSTSTPTFTQLEKQRHNDLVQEIKSGKTVAGAASSQLVEQDEERLLQKLFLQQDSSSSK